MTSAPVDPAAALLEAARPVVRPWLWRLVAAVADRSSDLTDRDEAVNIAVTDITGAMANPVDSIGASVIEELEALLAADVERQSSTPLSVFRRGTSALTSALLELGFPPSARDPFHAAQFPDDVFNLVPATWAEIDPSLAEPGLVWGAWKAMTVLDRRRSPDNG